MHKLFFILILASLVLVGAGCLGGGTPTMRPITLEYWRVEDDASDLSEVIEAYQKTHPQVTINVTRMPKESYQRELLTALAEERGPDLFNVPQTWLRGWMNKIEPMPKEMKIIERDQNQQGQMVTVLRKKSGISLIQFDRDFVEVVPESVVFTVPGEKKEDPKVQKIFGIPFSVDTLALYYNRDLLRNAGLIEPPTDWNSLESHSKKLKKINADKELEQSGVAMGWTNIRHYTDILVTLMMQNQTEMNRLGRANFHVPPVGWAKADPPGVEALAFYRSFAMENSSNWSWDRNFTGNLDFFIAGRTAYYFGFPSDAREIRGRAPRLDLGVAQIPQIDSSKRVNLAHFPVETVSNKSKYPEYAWDFLIFASQASQVSSFLANSKRPSSLRALLVSQRDDPEIGPFVKQVLTAEHWYLGYDYEKAQEIFGTLIEADEVEKQYDYAQGLVNAVGAMRSTYQPPKY